MNTNPRRLVLAFLFTLAVTLPCLGAQVPGVVVTHSPAASGIYIGSPSLALLPGGTYVASHDEFGPKSSEFTRAITHVFRSTDLGETWTKVATVDGAFWSTLFAHRGTLYLLGTDKHHGNVVIRKSTDAGSTWTSPTNAQTGLLRVEGQFHGAPVPVLRHNGRLWRGMEWRNPPEAWGVHYRAGVMSVPMDGDLQDASQWTWSQFIPSDRSWNGGDMGAWLEGNLVATPKGDVVNMLRVQTKSAREKAAVIRVSQDGKEASFDPATGFIDFPGGAKKFTIRYDMPTKSYWCLASVVPEGYAGENPGAVRNTLALTCSSDLTQWTVKSVLLHHPDVARHGFQYVDWQFDRDDIVALCRTAYDDGEGGANNYHDANYLTFHRFKGFRQFARDHKR
jgi:hypothetical protein